MAKVLVIDPLRPARRIQLQEDSLRARGPSSFKKSPPKAGLDQPSPRLMIRIRRAILFDLREDMRA